MFNMSFVFFSRKFCILAKESEKKKFRTFAHGRCTLWAHWNAHGNTSNKVFHSQNNPETFTF